MPNLVGAAKLEDLFREAAHQNVDKSDLWRLSEVLNQNWNKAFELFNLLL